MRSLGTLLIAAMLAANVSLALAHPPSPASVRPDSEVEALALQWFAHMRTGQIDRNQLVGDYSAHLSDDAVQEMSRYLKKHDYGASPLGAKLLQTRATGEQTFYIVKLIFPRGDAASLLIGLDSEGKITGLDILTMAGD